MSSDKVKVLFVCMGNICRSPSAWGVFRYVVKTAGLQDQIDIDSAGTHDYHIGDLADARSHKAAFERGIDLSDHRARQVSIKDFKHYDYILAMDNVNMERLDRDCPKEYREKVRLFLEFAPHTNYTEVPDPYYGGPRGFELVLDLIEAASEGLLEDIKQKYKLNGKIQA
jgi:protein-tyrosine phosphatase